MRENKESFGKHSHNFKPEILAPAGTKGAFWTALESGADAVYIGLKSFNARALARNFTLEETAALTQTAHKKGKKLFVALNSLIKESELPEIIKTLSFLEAIEVDGLIIQDLGLWRIARKYFPALRLHASTLMTIHNSSGVKIAHKMGFKRVVLAREMTLEEIRKAATAAPIEVEVFVHGALCFSYSGLCLFSSYFGGKSSTRGRCVQPCRRRYTWKGKQGTFFSMDDLCALEHIHELKKMGIHSLKIEGRLRPPHYIASVVRAFRMVLDSPPDDSNTFGAAQELILSSLGRRPTSGYLNAPVPHEILSPNHTANTGRFIGKVIETKGKEILLRTSQALSKGDRMRIIFSEKDTQKPFTVEGVREGKKQNHLWIKASTELGAQKNDLLFLADLRKSPLVPSNVNLIHPSPGKIKKLLKKSDNISRKICAAELTVCEKRKQRPSGKKNSHYHLLIKSSDIFSINNIRQAGANGAILTVTPQNVRKAKTVRSMASKKNAIIWALPPIIHESEIPFFRNAIARLVDMGFRDFQLGNIGQLEFLKDLPRGKSLNIYGSYTINILNSQAIRAAMEMGIKYPHFSVETDIENLELALSNYTAADIIFTIFGFLPPFTTRMDHPRFLTKSPVISPKGEHFFWSRRGNTNYLLPKRAVSFFEMEPRLRNLNMNRFIIDLSLWPEKMKRISFKTGGLEKLKKKLRGRKFNLDGELL